MNKLADDVEPSVRSELMEQVPHIAMYCQEYKSQLEHVVPDHLLPMVVKFLTDTNNQVRKTSQAALLVLLEQGLVEKDDVRQQVCPVIIRLTEADSLDDYRTEAVAVSSTYLF
jgi:serine/threonine-protein phosphatase 4 regulatory subunit 1